MKTLVIKIFLSITLFFSVFQINGQGTVMPLGPQAAQFSSMVRGYYFTAPTDFVICSLYVADDASTAAQSIEVVRFNNGTPPAFAGTTNDFVSLFYQANFAPNTPIACNIQVNAGEIIGIYGARGGGQVNSYNGIQHNTTIDGFPVTLFRSGMQASLATGQMANIWSENNGRIGRVFMTYNCCTPSIAPTSVTAFPATVSCNASTSLTLNGGTLQSGDQWVWYADSCGGTPIGTGPTINTTLTQTTTYYVRAEGVCDTTACASTTVNVISVDDPYWDLPANVVCTNDAPLNLDNLVTGTAGGVWSGTGVTGNLFDPSVGTQDVTYTVGTVPCEQDSTISFTVNPVPDVDPLTNIDVCVGDNVPASNFSSTPVGATFTWTNDNTVIGLGASGNGNVPNFVADNNSENIATGTITVTPTLNGCTGNDATYNINVNGDFSADWTVPLNVCSADGLIDMNNFIDGTIGGTWSGTGITGNSFDPSVGTQSITYTSGNVPCQVDLTQDITVNPTPVPNVVPDITVCSGETVSVNAFSSTPAGSSFSWTNNNTSIGLTASGNGNIADFTGENSSNNDITTTVTYTPELNGCTGPDGTFSITVLALPNAPVVNDTLICRESSATLNATAPGGNYEWFEDASATLSVGTGASFTTPILQTTQNYYVQTTVNGCLSDVSEVTVEVVPDIQVNAGPDREICDGEDVTLNATGASTYVWNNGVTNGVAFTPSNSGTYIVVGTSDLGCVNSDTMDITVHPMPETNFSADELSGCAPLSVAFTNLTSNLSSNDVCYWQFGDGKVYNGCDLAGRTYKNPGCYDVTLTVTTEHGCETKLKYDSYICVNPSPVANFNFSPAKPTTWDTNVEFQNFSSGANEYYWIFDDMGTSQSENPALEYPKEEGEYPVTLIAINEFGCSDTATDVLTIFGELLFYVPNAFTPDGDSYNDQFLPIMTSGFDPYTYNFKIFNRWGEVVFESQNHQVGWDGTFKGEMMQDGVYIWQIEYKETIADKRSVKRGSVTLIR